MDWHTTHVNNIHILTINGRFDAHGAPKVKAWFKDVTTTNEPQVLVQLGGVHFIDSAALAVLVAGLKRCHARGGRLILENLAQPVRIIFELTKMDQMFTILDSPEAAMANFDHLATGAWG